MRLKLGLIGSPIERSLSPVMHQAALHALGIDGIYALRPTTVDSILEPLTELQRGLWHGLNVTLPLKTLAAERVICHGHAKRARAVNTLWCEEDRLHGELTDVFGIQEPLRRRGLTPHQALILGTGGAARACAVALSEMACAVTVAARDVAKAEVLLRELSLPEDVVSFFDEPALRQALARSELILQATSAGLHGMELNLPWDGLHKGAWAFELIYNPRETGFLRAARAAGAELIEGWEMLLEQGALSLERWTQQAAPREVMRSALLSAAVWGQAVWGQD